MPKNPIVRLALRLGVANGKCFVCNAKGSGIQYHLFNIHNDGSDQYHGPSACSACAEKHGPAGVITRLLNAQEKIMVRSDAEEVRDGREVPNRVELTRKEYVALRALVAAGKFTAAPVVSEEHFAAVGSV